MPTILIAYISKISLKFLSGLKCLIAQTKLYKIKSSCKNQGWPLPMPWIGKKLNLEYVEDMYNCDCYWFLRNTI